MLNEGMFTHTHSEWETPRWLFDRLNKKFKFTLDPCATPQNAKCKRYYTKKEDGLKQPWHGRVFVNPPYGREVSKWVRKAWEEVEEGNAEFVVMLLPARTDTSWFHNYCLKYGKIKFLRGRLKFSGTSSSAPFPSMLILFKK